MFRAVMNLAVYVSFLSLKIKLFNAVFLKTKKKVYGTVTGDWLMP